jgi:hypothetical protein
LLIKKSYPHIIHTPLHILWIKKVNRLGEKQINYYICIIVRMFGGVNKKKG